MSFEPVYFYAAQRRSKEITEANKNLANYVEWNQEKIEISDNLYYRRQFRVTMLVD